MQDVDDPEFKLKALNNMVEMFRYYDKVPDLNVMANLTTGKPNLENPSSYDVKNARLEARIQEEKEFYQKKIEDLQNLIKKREEEKNNLDANIREINKIAEIEQQKKEEYNKKVVDYDNQIREIESQQREYEEKLREINEFEDTGSMDIKASSQDVIAGATIKKQYCNRKELQERIEKLNQDLAKEKEERKEEVKEKEREKIQATEKLRKDMLFQIKETKAQLLSLNDAELQNTTKLTIQQNHQLTSELEFQSKQTETLLYKNNKMKEQIVSLKKDIEIHKQVENELAKRSHFCQKVIKKLKAKIKELNEDMENAKKKSTTKAKPNQKGDKWDEKNKEELISFLESKLDEIEKKLDNTQNKYEVLKKKYKILIEKLYKSREKYKRTALLLTDYLDDLLNSSENVLSSDQDMHLNLDEIKEAKVPIKELDAKDKIALILVLLKQLQPYLSDYTPEHPAALELVQDQKSEADTAETLNRILNNIKVQTKRSEVGSRETGSRGAKRTFGKKDAETDEFRLPPINKYQKPNKN